MKDLTEEIRRTLQPQQSALAARKNAPAAVQS
jgi:hypothetical protein